MFTKNLSMIVSHIDSKGGIQSNDDHQQGVAELSGRFAAEFGMGDCGRLMGLLHDKGKEQAEWQKYIRGVTGYDKEYANVKSGPNHSYVGAIIAQKQYPRIAPLIAQPITGHHRGLYDYCDYIEETKRDIPHDVTIDEAMSVQLPNLPKLERFDLHHLVRMLFSCLVDADSLDTEAFMEPEQAKARGCHTSMQELFRKLEEYLQGLRAKAPDTEVNVIRNYVQEQCIHESQGKTGFYSLTVPTGGGKTLASVLWALHHAVKNNLSRIIIAIPYTSIIVQTASVLKEIFGEDNVLEHHSNVNPEDIKDEVMREHLQLATENWDYPIIVTTNVQLFESLFSNKRSDCRKLHNIVKSVIILDEVQTLPMSFLKPIVLTFDTLNRIFGVSILFTTASQPVLCGRIEGATPKNCFDALSQTHEIIPREARLYEKLRRAQLQFINGEKSYDAIAECLKAHSRVLCVVNTRKDAKELYDRLPKDDGLCLHLSRMMCPTHIRATIQNLKELMKDKKKKQTPIRVVSTQLIEAGVDIDFPVVYRQQAGLDSILQAAGRCNREGEELSICPVYVFQLAESHMTPYIKNCCGAFKDTQDYYEAIEFEMDFLSQETVDRYFKMLHKRISTFDKINVCGNNKRPVGLSGEQRYESIARDFHLIDKNQRVVIVNWEGSMDLVQKFKKRKSNDDLLQLLRKMMQYSVSVGKNDFEILERTGSMTLLMDNLYVIEEKRFYDKDTGLVNTNPWLSELLYIDE